MIEGSRIVLRDTAGNPRILLDAGGDDGNASIVLASHIGQYFQINSQPNGSVVLSIDSPQLSGAVSLSGGGLTIRSADGRLGITMGRIVDDVDTLTIYRDGQPVWQEPAGSRRARPAASSKRPRKSK